jgi:CRISPR/Cas system CSM-associated protein Csm2 small subunit
MSQSKKEERQTRLNAVEWAISLAWTRFHRILEEGESAIDPGAVRSATDALVSLYRLHDRLAMEDAREKAEKSMESFKEAMEDLVRSARTDPPKSH